MGKVTATDHVLVLDYAEAHGLAVSEPHRVGGKGEPELDRLSNILKTFNEQCGTTFADSDRIFRHIRDDIAPKVAADAGYRNAQANTPQPPAWRSIRPLVKRRRGP